MKKSLKIDRAEPQSKKMEFSFFPGCSLKASGHENTLSLLKFCDHVNIDLKELDDWNCCGSSSAHSIDKQVSENLPMRNISLAPNGKPLLISCPSCLIRMKTTYLKIKNNPDLKKEYETLWEKPFDTNLEIIHFFEIFNRINIKEYIKDPYGRLKKIKVAPYYGCMHFLPPELKSEPCYHGVMEKNLSTLGAEIISFGYGQRCCGTYLSAAKPEIAQKVVNDVISSAIQAGAECLVTACSMCHLNLEIRCSLQKGIPVFHFSELLSMALGAEDQQKWFPRHIIDPVPLLEKRGLI